MIENHQIFFLGEFKIKDTKVMILILTRVTDQTKKSLTAPVLNVITSL